MSHRLLVCPTCPALNRVPLQRLQHGPRCGKCKTSLSTEAVQSVDGPTLEMAVRSSPLPLIVDFWAPWCGPCQAFAPVFLKQAELAPTAALFLKVNTQDHPQVSDQYRIQGIPTLLVFSAGEEVARQSGAMSLPQFQSWFRSLPL